MLSSRDEVFEVLGRNPSDLVGEPETEWLEFKGEPYRIGADPPVGSQQKFELAKDISAFANKEGGVILVGVKTVKDVVTQEDIAAEVVPIPTDLVDPGQIMNVAHDWVFPRTDVRVRSHPVEGSEGLLWSIAVERARERDQPHVVVRSFVTEERLSGNTFAVFERSGSDNIAYAPQQVQTWINRGIHSEQAAPLVAEEAPLGADADEVLADDLTKLDLEDDQTVMFLQANPAGGSVLRSLYAGAADSLHDRMRSPRHHLRSHGFNLPDIERPERTPPGALRIAWPGDDSISVTRDGLATALHGQRHLTWASDRFAGDGEAWINPMSLVEFTLDFFRFFLMEVMPRSGSETYRWRVGAKRLVEGPVTLYLPERYDHFAEKESAGRDEFMSEWTKTQEPGAARTAFDALTLVYAEFGLDPAVMPFTSGEAIDEDELSQVGR